MTTKAKQIIVTSALGLWTIVSMCMLMGEDSPLHPMSEAEFLFTKLCALISLGASILAWRHADRKGMIYEVEDNS